MKGKTTAAVLVICATALVIMASRSNTRADAATAGGCLSADPGPSQPTLCQ
jgi:hypothetical protein